MLILCYFSLYATFVVCTATAVRSVLSRMQGTQSLLRGCGRSALTCVNCQPLTQPTEPNTAIWLLSDLWPVTDDPCGFSSAMCRWCMYTVSHKNVPLLFSGLLWQILTNLNNSFTGVFRDEMNHAGSWSRIWHLSLNVLLHYLVKVECSTVRLCIHTCIGQNKLHTAQHWKSICVINWLNMLNYQVFLFDAFILSLLNFFFWVLLPSFDVSAIFCDSAC